jgi:hypothetical protein
MNEEMHPELAAGLLKAQAEAIPVGKASVNEHHGYKYVSAEDMISEGRAALRVGGLSLFVAGWRVEALEKPIASADGKSDAAARVIVKYVLAHVSGQAYSWEASSYIIPGKGRPADKAELGAITANLAYAIRGLLLLPRVDEHVAIELRDDREFELASKAPASASRPVAAPAAAAAPAQRAPANDAPREAPAAAGDPAHGALAAEFKRRLADVAEWDQLGDLVGEIDAAKLPPSDLLDVRTEVACVGLSFAIEQEDLDFWAEKLKSWALPDSSPQRERVLAAFDAADARVERGQIQGAA